MKKTCKISLILIYLMLAIIAPFADVHANVSKHISAAEEKEIVDKVTSSFKDLKTPAISVVIHTADSKEAFLISHGKASLELNVHANKDTVFRFGSLTKVITAIRIKKYFAENNLDLTTDIRTFFPELALYPHKVTIEQMLTHSSGLPEFFQMPEILQAPAKPWTKNELFELILKHSSQFKPGEMQVYNNTGFYLLGLLLEEKGQDFNTFLAKTLPHSKLILSEIVENKVVLQRASGYSIDMQKNYVLPPFISSNIALGAGNIEGNPSDILQVLSKWTEYDLAPKKLDDSQKGVKIALGKYPLEWFFYEGIEMHKLENGKIYYGKGGQYAGYSSYYLYNPISKNSILLSSNQDQAIGELFALGIDILNILE